MMHACDEHVARNRRTKRRNYVLFVFDDFISSIGNNSRFIEILLNGRKEGVSILLTNQRHAMAAPVIRQNLSHVLLLTSTNNELRLLASGHMLSAFGASPILHFGLHCRISVRRTLDSSKLRLMLATSGQFWSLLDGYAFSGRLPRLVLAAYDRVWTDSGLTLHAHGSTYACIPVRMMLASGHMLPASANTDGQTEPGQVQRKSRSQKGQVTSRPTNR